MPDLGKYAFEVLSSYGVTFVMLLLITWISVRRARKVRAALEEVESRKVRNG
ncbi:heme exporter protein CcmD [Marivita hallyeonensis]|uniref:Heme exporter protein D n=1 Tax=Marivita hallyeonensis TaxID=996342 RepID=A0A1M5QZD7_9RHOB|nr:heme exporter protein D [Marivita hallyeonensis]